MENTRSDIYYHGPVVVFDLDDTLYSEREHAVGAYGLVASQPDFSTEWLSSNVKKIMTDALDDGKNPFDALETFLKDNNVNPVSSLTRLIEVYRHYVPRKLSLYTDAADVLEQLSSMGVKIAIITDGRSFTQRAKLRALGIVDRFHPDDILISEETGYDKLQPENFVRIVHHYPEASGFIYIGDNPAKDFEIPTLLGWSTYCLRNRGNNIHPQVDKGEIMMIDKLTEILQYPPFI